jgi:GH15 family glucan-1,4-alpha-glucosidase
LVYATEDFRGVDFGFRDVITITGELCMPSILKYKASLELAELFDLLKKKDKAEVYRNNARRLKEEIPQRFSDSRGMLLASTGKSKQADIWSTVMAVYYGIIEGDQVLNVSRTITEGYKKGLLAKSGNIRHIFIGEDFSEKSAWEKSLVRKGDYQNGGYWGTPTGWVCYVMAQTDLPAAKQLAKEYIDNLRAGDFRKGGDYGEPWECYNLEAPQNAIYMTTVTSPYTVFKHEK